MIAVFIMAATLLAVIMLMDLRDKARPKRPVTEGVDVSYYREAPPLYGGVHWHSSEWIVPPSESSNR